LEEERSEEFEKQNEVLAMNQDLADEKEKLSNQLKIRQKKIIFQERSTCVLKA